MKNALIVRHAIPIQASAETVWKVLTSPKYMRQWDELPEDYGDADLALGSVIDWVGYSRLTVVDFVPHTFLKLALYSYSWKMPPEHYDIAYKYSLSGEVNETLLTLEIGDFSVLENGQNYFDASLEFALNGSELIRELAEESHQ